MMDTNSLLENIKIILNENSQFRDIKNAIEEFYSFYSSITGISGRMNEIKEISNYTSANGIILSSQNAAGQIFDYIRTTKFLRALKLAIDHSLDNSNNNPIKILYAGPGPYGSLLLPLLCLYEASKIKID